MPETTPQSPADMLRSIAAEIRNTPHNREAIAAGFELIAAAMTPCEDCGEPVLTDIDDLQSDAVGQGA